MQQALLSRAVASALFVIMTSVVTQPCAAATTTTIDKNSQPLVKDSNTRLYGSIT